MKNLLVALAFSFVLFGAGFSLSEAIHKPAKTPKPDMVKYGAAGEIYSFWHWTARENIFEFDDQFLTVKGLEKDLLVPIDRVTVEDKVGSKDGIVLTGVAYGASDRPKFDIATKLAVSLPNDEEKAKFQRALAEAKGEKHQ